MTSTSSPFAHFSRTKVVLLTTYRRDGTPVGTPVNIVVGGSQAFFRTYDAAWKVKRLRNNPHVELAPSTFRGSPTGPSTRAMATLTDGEDCDHARRLLARKYPILQGILVPLMHRLKKFQTLHYELTAPTDNSAPPDQ